MAAEEEFGVVAQARDPQNVVITVTGEVDAATGNRLRSGIKDSLTDGYKRVLLDMSGVTFIDSAGLRVLIDSQKVAESMESKVAIESASEQVTRLLEMTALTARFMA